MTTTDDAVGPGPASTPDLDAWRAEAGEAAQFTVHIPKAPWHYGFPDGAFAFRDVVGDATGRGFVRGESSAEWPAIGAFIAAARTGWPRDAARVGVLCERVALLERLLLEALDGWYVAHFPASPRRADAETIARLRALAAGTAAAGGEPTK